MKPNSSRLIIDGEICASIPGRTAYAARLAGRNHCSIDHAEDVRYRVNAIRQAYGIFAEMPDWLKGLDTESVEEAETQQPAAEAKEQPPVEEMQKPQTPIDRKSLPQTRYPCVDCADLPPNIQENTARHLALLPRPPY